MCVGALDVESDTQGRLEPAAAELFRGALARARWLAESTTSARETRELAHETWLREVFGVAPSASIGAYAGWSAGESALSDNDLIVRPVHLQLARDHIILAPPGATTLAADEAQALLAIVNDNFAGRGIGIDQLGEDRWRLRCETPLRLQSWSSALASGRDIFDYLPQGEDTWRWRRLHNEIQMLWHDHPVNVARETRGESPINGLWIEGRSTLLSAAGAACAQVLAQTPVVAGLARAAGIPVRDWTPATGATDRGDDELASALAQAQPVLVELALWEQDTAAADWRGITTGWSALAAALAPALSRTPRTQRLELVLTGRERIVRLGWSPADGWKFWRRFDADRLLAGARRDG